MILRLSDCYICEAVPGSRNIAAVVALGSRIHHARTKNICQRADRARARVCPLVCVRKNILILSLVSTVLIAWKGWGQPAP